MTDEETIGRPALPGHGLVERGESHHDDHNLGTDLLRIAIPVAILAAGFVGYFLLGLLKSEPEKIRAGIEKPTVRTVPVHSRDNRLDIDVDGIVVPHREVQLASEVAGRIVFKAPECRAGRYVTKGTTLLKIDSRDYALEHQRLTKQLRQADIQLDEIDVESKNTESLIELAREDLRLAQNELKRLGRLAGSGIITESALDKSRQAEVAARNALRIQSNQIQLLATRREGLLSAQDVVKSQLEKAQLDWDRCTIAAPLDGMVVTDQVQTDWYVQKGTLLATIEDTSAVEVQCKLRMDQLYWLWLDKTNGPVGEAAEGQPTIDDYEIAHAPASVVYRLDGKDYAWGGRLARYESIGLDERTRMVPCRVIVDDPRSVQVLGEPNGPAVDGPPALVRGMYVKIKLHARPAATFVAIPEAALRPRGVVWVVEQGKLKIVPVTIAVIQDGMAIVRDDRPELRDRARVVVSPLAAPTAGMEVQEAESPDRADASGAGGQPPEEAQP